MATTTATQIQQLYVGLLGRAADQGGLNWWVEEVTTGGRTLEDIRASFVTSTEYTTTYGAATTRTDLVTAIYSNLFERTPSADELAYWVSTDTRPADQLVTAFLEFASTADQAVINNKTFVAQTYTDTAGADFNATAAAQIIANVDGTTASVNTALDSLQNGALPGQVPALGLINAIATTEAAYVAQQKAAFAANAAADTSGDSLVSAAEAKTVYDASVLARKDVANGADVDTLVIEAELKVANKELAAARDAAVATTVTGGATAVANYEKAVADRAALKANVKADVDGATASVNTELTAAANSSVKDAVAALDPALDTGAKLYAALSSSTYAVADRAALVDAIKGLPHASSFTTLANNDFAIAKADAALNVATADSPAKAVDDLAGGVGKTYLSEVGEQKAAATLLENAKAADAKVVADKAVYDALATLDTAATNAKTTAINGFEADHPTTDLQAIGTGALTADGTKSDVFYFASAKATANDVTIANFGTAATGNTVGANDYIVLGKDVTFNTGALTTGDNNKLEFFLVQKGSDTLVVLETQAFGSSTTTNTATGAGLIDSPDAAVITLTGVTVDQLSFNAGTGVLSHV